MTRASVPSDPSGPFQQVVTQEQSVTASSPRLQCLPGGAPPSLRAAESLPHIVDVIGNRKSRRPLVVATGLPNAKARSLLQAAGQDLQILAASNREELATWITRQPPDVILLDPAWRLPDRSTTPSMRLGDRSWLPAPTLLWTDASVVRALMKTPLYHAVDLLVAGVDDSTASLMTSIHSAALAAGRQILLGVETTLTQLPAVIAGPMRELLAATDPGAARELWERVQRLPRATLRRRLRAAGLAAPHLWRRVVSVRLLFEHDRRGESSFAFDALPGAQSPEQLRRDLHALGYPSRTALERDTTGHFVASVMSALLDRRAADARRAIA